MHQWTTRKPVTLEGVGLHSGKTVRIVLSPAPPNSGIVFNVATIIHSYQVMLLAALIVAYHFFDVHLRPAKFPLDGVMFTGRATYGYMKEEHPLVAAAIGDPALQAPSPRPVVDRVAPATPRWMGLVSVVVGLLFLVLGLLLVGLGLWDALC